MNRQEIERKVSEIVVNQLGLEDNEVKMDSSFESDLGGDSIDFVEVCMTFEKEFGITIPDGRYDNCRTVKDLCDMVEELI